MSEATTSAVIKKHHVALLEIMKTIETSPGTMPSAQTLGSAIWPALKDYGLRSTNGTVYDGSAPAVFPVEPGETENRVGWPEPRS